MTYRAATESRQSKGVSKMEPSLKGEQLDAEIAARPHAKVTKQSIEQRIAKVDYVVAWEKVTICNITLVNGFSVRGESACVDPRNFNFEIGKSLAYKQAFDNLWLLEGYLLAERLYAESLPKIAA
jgi:hypothetical protein